MTKISVNMYLLANDLSYQTTTLVGKPASSPTDLPILAAPDDKCIATS